MNRRRRPQAALTKRLRALKDMEKLDGYLERILQADTLEAMEWEHQ